MPAQHCLEKARPAGDTELEAPCCLGAQMVMPSGGSGDTEATGAHLPEACVPHPKPVVAWRVHRAGDAVVADGRQAGGAGASENRRRGRQLEDPPAGALPHLVQAGSAGVQERRLGFGAEPVERNVRQQHEAHARAPQPAAVLRRASSSR